MVRYEEKRWVPKEGKHQRQELPRYETRNSDSYSSINHNAPKESKGFRGSISKGNAENIKVSLPTPPPGPNQVSNAVMFSLERDSVIFYAYTVEHKFFVIRFTLRVSCCQRYRLHWYHKTLLLLSMSQL